MLILSCVMGELEKPILRAGEWTVRPTNEADRGGIAQAGRDPHIRLMPFFGTNFVDEWAGPWVARAQTAWASSQLWVFSILDAQQRYVGSVMFTPDGEVPGIEVGYWVLSADRNRGAATAALRVLLPWMQAQLAPAQIWAKVFDRNARSLRVLAKSGFEQTSRKGEFLYFTWRPPAGG